jgi:outer membrane lipoprotein carrier protein
MRIFSARGPSQPAMTPRSRAALALALALAAGSPAAGEQRGAASEADRCRDRAAGAVQSHYEGVRDVSAHFAQTTHGARLGTTPSAPATSSGRVSLAKPGKMRWTYEAPEPSLVVSDGKTVWIFDPAFGEVQKLPASEGFLTGAAAQFLLGAGDMRRDFKVAAISCSATAAELELTPRQPATYEKLVLSVDPSSGNVNKTRIVDLLGNVVEVEFKEQRFNLAPGDSEFQFQVPEGVKVIEIAP